MSPERRIPRVPFVRPCTLILDDGVQASACLVNLSILGAYLGHDDPFAGPLPALPPDLPRLGQVVRMRFALAEGAAPVVIDGRVSWVNPKQQHPVHSLPPGFGVQFHPLADDVRNAIDRAVQAWLDAHPGAR